ncbi:MAG: peptidoglycan-binding protein, partial [Pseudomonadota bacterium]
MTHATLRRIAALSLAAFATASCATAPGKVATIGQPKTPVARTITNFSHAKRCMDRLFAENGRRGLLITADEIPDATQSVSVGARDMVISALSDMSLHSGAFDFFTVEPASGAIVTLQEQFSPLNRLDAARVPRVYIRGSISQSDNNVATDGAQASVTLPNVSLGVGRNQAAGTISIDLQIARLASRTIVPGVTASNTITIVSSDESQSARGLINGGSFGAGLSVSLGSSEREGRGQAVRTLMDYSLIELVGKWTKVPYQRCLELPSTDPAVMQTARERYDDLDPEARTRAVQIALAATGEYAGPANGVMSLELQDAVT